MSDETETANLPAQVVEALVGIPKALIPSSIKALDRLIGATVDIPVAWLAQQKARIDAQTEAYTLVEASIAKAVASEAGADQETVARAVDVLVRKAYREQVNREAVATAMLEDLSSSAEQTAADAAIPPVDEDWLNVFERYAEDASTERMQKLWGRVLAGEVRQPGRFSMRTLRFLSEFSQADGVTFAEFCASAFGDCAPAKLNRPDDQTDIRPLIYLESAGLIQGASGLGLSRTLKFNAQGYAFLREGNLILCLSGQPHTSVKDKIHALTPLGQELLLLLPGRDARAAARKVAHAIRVPEIEAASLGVIANPQGQITQLEILWQKEPAAEQVGDVP